MMISGVCDMEAALVRASLEKDFGGKEVKIPTAEQFKLLRAILPTLTLIRKISEKLSSDEVITMDQALLQIYLLREKVQLNLVAISQLDDDSGFESFLTLLLAQLDQRFENCGANFHHYRLGHFLHPYYKGVLLKKVPTPCYDETIQELVEAHPSTSVHKQKSLDNAAKVHDKTLTDVVELMDEDADVNAIYKDLNKSVLTQQQQEAQDASHPPIRNEIDSFVKKIVLDPEINVLQWWSIHKTEFPLLSALARSVYCHPASSASSERAFSQAGLTLTSKRQRMNVSTLEKLCFVNQNFKLLAPMVRKWKTSTEEEQGEPLDSDDEEEEESVHEIMEASQLESSVPPWVGFREREKAKKRAASPDPDSQLVIDLDSAPPSGSSTPMAKRKKGGKGKVKSSSQASQSLLGDLDSDD